MKISVKPHIEIARISKEGFWLTAILVAMLWCLVVTNRLIVYRAEAETSRALRELRYLRLQKGARHVGSPDKRRMPPPGRRALYQLQADLVYFPLLAPDVDNRDLDEGFSTFHFHANSSVATRCPACPLRETTS